MKRIFIFLTVFAVLLCLSPPAQSDMTHGLSHYTNNLGYVGSGGTNDPLYNIINEIESSLISSAGAASILFTPGTAPTGVEGTVYYDSASNGLLVHTGSAFVTIDTAGASSLDTAYNTGATIDVDGDPVSLTTSATDNNRVLDVTQNDTTNNPAAVLITNSGTGAGLTFATTGTNDATGTSTLWALSAAGTVTGTALSVGNGDLTFTEPGTNDITVLADGDGILTISAGSMEDIDLNLATADYLTVTSSTGLVNVDWGAVDNHIGLNALVFDGAVANTITQTGTGTGDDLTIAQAASAQDASLILNSSGTGADALSFNATAGGINLDAANSTIVMTNTANGSDDDFTIEVAGTQDASLILQSAGTGGDAVSIITSNAAGDIKINSGDQIDIDAADLIDIAIAGAATEDFSVTNTGGSIVLSASEDVTDAINIDATAGGIDIDATGEAGQDIVVTNTGGSISLVATESAVDSIVLQSTLGGIDILCDAATSEDIDISNTGGSVHIVATEAVDDSVNVDSVGLDVDASGSIVLTSTENAADSIVLQSTVGGIDILCDASDGEALDIVNTGGPLNLKSTEEGDASIHIETTTATGQLQITVDDTTTDALEIDVLGGIDLDAADDVSMVLTTSTDAEDFTIQVDGDDNCSIILDSDGSGADAIKINASHATTGGIDIDAGSNGINIKATGGDVKLENTTAKDIILDATAGRVLVTGTESAANAIHLYADGANGEIYLQAKAGGVDIDVASGDITLDNTGAATDEIMLNNATGTAASAATEHDAAIQLHASAGGIGLLSALNGDDSIRIETNGGDDENITIRSNQGTGQDSIYLLSDEGGIDIVTSTHTGASATTESDAAIQLEALLGGIGLYSTLNADDAIRIETNGGDDENITIRSHQGTGQDSIYLLSDEGGVELAATAHTGASAATEHDAAIQLHASAGGIGILSALDSDDSIRIETNGGDNENITIRSNQGTGADSIYLLSDEGGIELEATGNTATTAIVLDATAGGITLKVCDEKNLTMGNADGDAYFIVAASNTAGNEDVRILNTNGTNAAAIDIQATAGGIYGIFADDKDFNFEGGQFLLTANHDTGDTIKLHCDAGGSQTINLLNDGGTTDAAIDLEASAGGIDIDGVKSVTITSTENEVDAVKINATVGGIQIWADGGIATEDIHLDAISSSVIIDGGEANAAAVQLDASHTDGGITIDYGTANMTITGTTGDFISDSDLFSIDGTGTSNISITANAIGEDFTVKQDGSVDGSLILSSDGTSTTDALIIDAIAGGMDIDAQESITVDIAGGVAADADIILTNTPGTDAAAIYLNAVAGGMKLHVPDGKELVMGHITDDTYVKVAPHGTASSEIISIVNAAGTADGAIVATSTAGGMDINVKEMFTVDVSGGTAADCDIILTNTTGTDEAAISLAATAGGVKIAAHAAKDVDIDGGQINLTSSHAVTSGIVIDATGAGSGTTLQLSTTDGAILLDADGATYGDILMETVDDVQMTIGGHFRIVDDDLMAFGTGDDVTLNYDEDGDDDLQIKGPVAFETTYCQFDHIPTFSKWGANGTFVWGGAATGTAGDENVMMFHNATFIYHIMGDNTAELGPQMVAGGFDISLEDADNEGIEICGAEPLVGGCKDNFLVGTDAFYLKAKIYLTDISGTDELLVGFRKVEAFQSDVEAYTDYACIGVIAEAGDFNTKTDSQDSGTPTETDVTDAGGDWEDLEAHTLEVYVDAAKAITFKIDGDEPTGVPTVSWADADVVVPFIFMIHHTHAAELTYLQSWECGLQ